MNKLKIQTTCMYSLIILYQKHEMNKPYLFENAEAITMPIENEEHSLHSRESNDFLINEEQPKKRNYYSCALFAIALIVTSLIFPIMEFIEGNKYNDSQLNCYPNGTIQTSKINLIRTIGIKYWFNILAIFGVIDAIFFIVSMLGNFEYIIYTLGLYFVVILFRFTWLITGCFMFWKDCSNFNQLPISNFAFIIIVCSFIGMTISTSILCVKVIETN